MNKTEELKKRLKNFAIAIVHLYESLPERRRAARTIGHQLLRSGTSVAANHREACRARSRAEFVSKIEVCIQEADETMLWLELLGEGCRIDSDSLRSLHEETNEILSILVATVRTAKS